MTPPRASRPVFTLTILLTVAAAVLLSGCQRGEKSCRYYSLVLEKT